ncbi:MAG TPA: hydroxymethylbilane synthase [Candidatus Saccharimonadales bacterium]|nr:hydroxymethylbilane synthase [Candidatus Saccharimonadales bacterium]
MTAGRIAIGTRGSALARTQARMVADALERDGRETRFVVIETAGDRRAPDTAWGEGAFVAAIESALLEGRVDVAVHSAKDVPIEQDERLRIAAYLPRADPRDALVVRAGAAERRLADLAPGTRVGTDSPRRTGFVRALRPDLLVHPIHGNVDTRLRRLDDGETDALVLACAGLDRLGLGDRISERLAPDLVPPAPGQGALAIQIRADDGRMVGLAAGIDDPWTRAAVEAERAFLETSGGGCRAPIGALATIVGGEVHLLAGHADPDGSTATIARRRGPHGTGRAMAVDLARELRPARHDPSSEPPSRLTPGEPRRRVLVTRPEDQAAELGSALRDVGLEPVDVPAIAVRFEPADGELDRVAGALERYRWIVVTSANGAEAILAAAQRVRTELGSPRWAAIAPATAAVLEREGIAVDFRPSRALGRVLAAELPVEPGDAVLVVRGALAGDGVATVLRARGAAVDDVVAYRTRIGPTTSRPLLRRALGHGPVDAVILTSASTVRGLASLGDAEGIDVRSIPAVCIGPATHGAAVDAGFRVVAESASQDAGSLAEATAAALRPATGETA